MERPLHIMAIIWFDYKIEHINLIIIYYIKVCYKFE
jgi:hypothetical protein